MMLGLKDLGLDSKTNLKRHRMELISNKRQMGDNWKKMDV